jgi:RHS repeat-associated protein
MTKPNLALNTTTPEAPVPTIHYELTNHLGNVMAVITDEPAATETPAVESLTDYYPFGMTLPGRSYNAHTSRHGFTGHEKESDLAEGIYTTEYRLYDARVGRWLSVDPLFEKYVDMSPYNYCMLNPVMMVDPDGRELNLSGSKSKYTFKLLKAYVRNESKDVDLKLSEEGVVSYSLKEGAAMPESLNRLKEVIDSKDKVNIISEDSKFTSSGNLYVGGAFMGNQKQEDGSYVANQEVNPYVLSKMDEYDNNSVGKNLLHEITEAHEGIKLSREKNISSPYAKSKNSVYHEAHERATPQTPVEEQPIPPIGPAEWIYWGVKDDSGKINIIQTFSKDDL